MLAGHIEFVEPLGQRPANAHTTGHTIHQQQCHCIVDASTGHTKAQPVTAQLRGTWFLRTRWRSSGILSTQWALHVVGYVRSWSVQIRLEVRHRRLWLLQSTNARGFLRPGIECQCSVTIGRVRSHESCDIERCWQFYCHSRRYRHWRRSKGVGSIFTAITTPHQSIVQNRRHGRIASDVIHQRRSFVAGQFQCQQIWFECGQWCGFGGQFQRSLL